MASTNTVHHTYGDANYPNAVTDVTCPASTGLVANCAYDADGNLTGLTAVASISDAWTFDADEQVATTEIDGSTSAPATYNANRQITSAANLASSTSNDSYTLTPNGEITADTPPSGPAIEFTYNAGDELCNVGASSVSCGSTPTSGTSYQFSADGERSVATPYSGGTGGVATYYDWNAYGELCNVATSVTTCGATPTSGTSYTYNGDGLRLSAVTPAATTDYTWDTVSGSSIPLDINDATTSAGATTDTSYLYGPLLFGGTAPIEQITTTAAGSHASFLVTNPTGVQEVVGSTGTTQELALYSLYGQQTIVSGSNVTPFAFQGSYSDPTGLIYLINRYYDPTTDQFLSIDPDVAETNQPYVFVNDDPLNAEDPLGQWGGGYPRANWAQEVEHWESGSVTKVIGLGLGILSAGSAAVVFVASSPEVGLVAGGVSIVAGVGAESIDLKSCGSGDDASCPGAILGLPGIVNGFLAFGPEGSGVVIASRGAGAIFGPAVAITDVIINVIESASAPAKVAPKQRKKK